MRFIRFILIIIIYANFSYAQKGAINEVFIQNIMREDFNQKKNMFPTITGLDGRYAMTMDSLGYYGIGSGKSEYPLLINWNNDLIDFEIKTSIRIKDEEIGYLRQKIQKETGQIAGLILKYNPEKQEALIFQINGVRQYRLCHLKNEKIRSLTGEWSDSEHIRRNDKNEITIRTINNDYEFYINGKFLFKKNLNRLKEIVSGRFGFYLGKNTQVMVDNLYISALDNYDGENKLFNLTQEEAQAIIDEKNQIKTQLSKEKEEAVKELKNVIVILENELHFSNKMKDSLQRENIKFTPFINIINENGDFIFTLTKDLKEQIEKNQELQNQHQKLVDSIAFLIKKHEDFKLDYLRIIDKMTSQPKDSINEKK